MDPLCTRNEKDVFRCKSRTLPSGVTVLARLGLYNENDGKFIFTITEEQMTQEKLAMLQWNEFYLNASLSHLKLTELKHKQLVVCVDKEKKLVIRGFYIGTSDEKSILIGADDGQLRKCNPTLLYAPTQLVATTELNIFSGILNGLEVFMGSDMLSTSVTSILELHIINVNILLKVTSKGYIFDAISPTVDVVTVTHGIHINNVLFSRCNLLCVPNIQKLLADNKEITIIGYVTHAETNGLICIHSAAGNGDKPTAYLMENFLEKLNISYLQNFCRKQDQESVEFRQSDTVYLAEYDTDELIYRAKILNSEPERVEVEFIDYGNSSYVTYDKIFLAEDVSEKIAVLPPLVTKMYLQKISKLLDTDADILTKGELEFVVKSTTPKRQGLYQVVVYNQELLDEDGKKIIINKRLMEEGLAIREILN